MKIIRTEDAVGHVLCHDLTQIIPGVVKDAVFRKGHIVREEDISVLLSMGKENLYIMEVEEGMLHENEAALILKKICQNDHMKTSGPKEGKIDLFSEVDGLLKVDTDRLYEVNSLGEIIIASRHGNTTVKQGDKLAGTRIIPLLIEETKMVEAKKLAGDSPLFKILPFQHKKVGIITTGSEIQKGRIKDSFGPVVRDKLSEYETEIIGQTILGDKKEDITEEIHRFMKEGADLVICTGGMSVDPDDNTPGAIKDTGAKVVSYGAPVLPGAMFLLAYYDDKKPVIGLPGCVMYSKRTIFDLILPRIMADDNISPEEIAKLGHGGLCLSCEVCTFPNCGFGK